MANKGSGPDDPKYHATLAYNEVGRVHHYGVEAGHSTPKRDLDAAGRIRNVRAKVAALKHAVRQLAFQRELTIEHDQAEAARELLPAPVLWIRARWRAADPGAWFRPGHWTHTAGLVVCVGVMAVAWCVLLYLLATKGGI